MILDQKTELPEEVIKPLLPNSCFIILDENSSIREMNDEAVLLLAKSNTTELNQNTFLRRDGTVLQTWELPWTQVYKTGKIIEDSEIGLSVSDKVIWLSVSASPLRNSTGDVSSVLLNLIPLDNYISGSRRLNFKTLFENLTIEVHVWKLLRDSEDTVINWELIYVNPPVLKTWGRNSAEEIIGKTTDEIFGPGSSEHYMPVVQKIIKEGTAYSFEDYFPHLDKHFKYTSIPLGEYFITIGFDVTSIKKLQENSERQFLELKAVLDSTHDSILVYDMNRKIIYANNSFLTLNELESGIDLSDMAQVVDNFELYQSDGKLVPYEDWPITRVLKGEIINEEEIRVRRKDADTELYLSFNGSPVYDNKGEQIFAITLTRNVTKQKNAEFALKESENRFRMLADNISQMIWIIDENGKNFWVNKRFVDYTGLTSEDLLTTQGITAHHPDYLDAASKRFSEAIQNGTPYEDTFPLKGKDGIYRWFLTRAVPIRDDKGKIKQWFGTNTDITEERKLLENLKESQLKYQRAEELAHLGSFTHVLDTGIVHASDEFWKIFGVAAEKNIAPWENIVSRIHPEDFERIRLSKEVNKPDKAFETELRIFNEDGSQKYIYLYDAAETDQEGKVISRHGAVIDITERKSAELKLTQVLNELKASETKLKNAQKMARIGNVEADLNSGEIFLSDEVFEIFERPIEAGQPTYPEVLDYLFPEDRIRIVKSLQNLTSEEPIDFDFKVQLPGEKIKYLTYVTSPVFQSGIQAKRIGTVQDITDRKLMEIKLEETLRNLQDKVAEKEILVRELYHRTKNNLQIISSLLNLRAGTISNTEARIEFIDMKNRIRAMSLVHEKLYQSQNLSRLNLGSYIKELTDLLLESHSETKWKIKHSYNLIDIDVNIDTAIPCGFVITELVLNIVKHAFPGNNSGKMNIILRKGDEGIIEILISDNGVGIVNPELFLETKLGLQIVKGLVEDQLNGTLTLDSSKGTCWHISFKDRLYKERI